MWPIPLVIRGVLFGRYIGLGGISIASSGTKVGNIRDCLSLGLLTWVACPDSVQCMDHPTTSDNDRALHIAMEVFQRQGFEATSMSDLVAATGMNRASLYSTFGSKHQFYLATLTYWRNRCDIQIRAVMGEEQTFTDMVREVLAVVVRQAKEGNLMVGAAVELAGDDPLTSQRVRESWTKTETEIRHVLNKAGAGGHLEPTMDLRTLASTILVFLQGMYVVGRVEEEEGWVAAAAAGIEALLKRA